MFCIDLTHLKAILAVVDELTDGQTGADRQTCLIIEMSWILYQM